MVLLAERSESEGTGKRYAWFKVAAQPALNVFAYIEREAQVASFWWAACHVTAPAGYARWMSTNSGHKVKKPI